jgi:crotonobetainyl-CoA:carnitine CoA-transferase CaiB-like acyl-CoA transferase
MTSLSGIRVVDLTASVAGPFATQILGDLGADVIKIERTGTGDDTRAWGPPFWHGESASFLALNRNKRSLSVDVKTPRGRQIVRELLDTADVFIQNLRPGAAAKLGFSHDELKKTNPGIIVCDISGFGPRGAMKDDPAYDPLLQGFGGLMSLTGEQGGPPVRIPASILDQGTAMWSVIGILEALRARDRTGTGSLVQTSLLGTALQWLPAQVTGYLADGTVPQRLGSGTVGISPYQAFPTSDGYLIIAAGNDRLYSRLCGMLERPDLLSDERFIDNPGRVRNRAELAFEIEKSTKSFTTRELSTALTAVDVPVAAINTLDQVLAHEQVHALGLIHEHPHPRISDYQTIATPVEIDGSFTPVHHVPPLLGEHTVEVLSELGYKQQFIDELVTEHVVDTNSKAEQS